MKKSIISIVLCTLFLTFTGCRRENIDERIHREAKEFTEKNCPREMDPYTTIDSACYDMKNRIYSYNYTVQGLLDVDSIYTDELLNSFRETLLGQIKTSIQMKALKDQGVTFAYRYFSQESGKTLMNITFTKEDYKH